MGLSYYQQATGGDTSSSRALHIWQYPNTSNAEDECENAVLTALKDMCEQLLNYWSIDGYTINMDYDHPYANTSDLDTAHSTFENYLDGRNPPVGVHLLVTTELSDGEADAGNGTGNTSFSTWRTAVMGTKDMPMEWWQNGMIQESLHPTIDSSLKNVYEMGTHGANSTNENTEHDFGKVFDNGAAQPISPLVTGYLAEHADHGDCGRYYERTGFTRTMTHCTKDAVSYTANNES